MDLDLSDGLLIANPALDDVAGFEFMSGRMVYIVEHSQEGAIGVALNKNFTHSFNDLAETVPALRKVGADNLLTDKVMCGGPVGDTVAWLLRTKEDGLPNSFSNDFCTLSLGEDSLPVSTPGRLTICGIGTFGWGGRATGKRDSQMPLALPSCDKGSSSKYPF